MRNISFSENSRLFEEAIELKKQLNALIHQKATIKSTSAAIESNLTNKNNKANEQSKP